MKRDLTNEVFENPKQISVKRRDDGGVNIVPQLVIDHSDMAIEAYINFFMGNISNLNTRTAYSRAVRKFFKLLEDSPHPIGLKDIRPIHVAAWIRNLEDEHSTATAKQHLAAIRSLFDHLVVGQIIASNPATSVKGKRESITTGKTPVWAPEQLRQLLDSLDITNTIGMRDRAIISTLIYTFCRASALVAINVDDIFSNNRRRWVRLHEKGGRYLEMPCHHNLDEALHQYIDDAGIADCGSEPLFRSTRGRSNLLTTKRMDRDSLLKLVKRKAVQAGIPDKITNHTFRASGITAYLSNGGRLEYAQQMAGHASARTTKLYDRRNDAIKLDEIERIVV